MPLRLKQNIQAQLDPDRMLQRFFCRLCPTRTHHEGLDSRSLLGPISVGYDPISTVGRSQYPCTVYVGEGYPGGSGCLSSSVCRCARPVPPGWLRALPLSSSSLRTVCSLRVSATTRGFFSFLRAFPLFPSSPLTIFKRNW